MTYNNALKKIWRTARTSGAPTLERMRLLCRYLGDPQKELKFIHIAGTNGKGSFAAMLSSVLLESGYKTGRYISPYILDFRERMTIDGEMISCDELSIFCTRVFDAVKRMKEDICRAARGENVPYPIVKSIIDGDVSADPVQFEIVTAIAFLYFLEHGCDIVVLECGLGGRYDATNVIDAPIAAVLMSIGFDHTELLGDTIEKIATEKCGIIKKGTCEVISSPQYAQAYSVIADYCDAFGSRLTIPAKSDMNLSRISLGSLEFTYKNEFYRTGMCAAYQMINACTVIEAVEALRRVGMKIHKDSLLSGLGKAWLPARFEVMGIFPAFIIDGAHNQQGILAFCDSLEQVSSQIEGKVTFVMGMLRDKNPEKALLPFAKLVSEKNFKVDKIITLAPDNKRAMSAHDLASVLSELGLDPECKIVPLSFGEGESLLSRKGRIALKEQLNSLTCEDAVISFGSLYLSAEMRRFGEDFLSNFSRFK